MKSYKPSKNGLLIYYITIFNGNIRIQRVEGGGQINKHVGTNANQGGQSAKKNKP